MLVNYGTNAQSTFYVSDGDKTLQNNATVKFYIRQLGGTLNSISDI